jgi:Acetyltransferases
MLQYEKLKKEDIKEASELAARAYFDYIYITIFFDLKERQRGLARFLAINRKGNFKGSHMLTARLDGRMVAEAALEPPGYKQPSVLKFILSGYLKMYFLTNWKHLHAFLAKDQEAGTPCHDYQKKYPDVWYLSMIEVDPSFHNQGIGTEFLSYLEDYVRRHGGKTMVLFTNNRENLSFYTKRDYQVFNEFEITHNGQTMGNWSLKKLL